MGASLYTSLYPNEKPNVGLLNIGSEEFKGNETIKETYQILNDKKSENYDFSGYIEGNHLMDGEVNVIVSDGFTGNVALKTAEGTANFITSELKKAMTGSIIGKISSLLNISNLKKFKKRLDPRLYNGAIFIGLNSPVVKSHGGTDFIGFSNSLCNRYVGGRFSTIINCRGVCLTLISFKSKLMEFYLSNETLVRSKFQYLKTQEVLNLELPLKYGTKISGHIKKYLFHLITLVIN